MYPFLIAFLFLISCQPESAKDSISGTEALDDMSIFHLPSTWVTQQDEEITFAELEGETLVVVMIYTACRTACPRLVADMRHIRESIPTKKRDGIKYVLVSIDPKNDTPERLRAFAKDNGLDGPEWLFLQGTEAGTRDFANVLAVKYKQINPIDFSHSNIISVFDKKGVLKYQKEGLGLENNEVIEVILKVN